jgi:hypothetical protein
MTLKTSKPIYSKVLPAYLAIIRNATNQQLAPTLKEIIFQMAEKYYPKEWPQIVEDALRRLTNAT